MHDAQSIIDSTYTNQRARWQQYRRERRNERIAMVSLLVLFIVAYGVISGLDYQLLLNI